MVPSDAREIITYPLEEIADKIDQPGGSPRHHASASTAASAHNGGYTER
jgi:hypothetical protein